jgi:hypothetical protein
MQESTVGRMRKSGSSLDILAKKYAGTPYIPLDCSLRKTGLSSGNSKIKL